MDRPAEVALRTNTGCRSCKNNEGSLALSRDKVLREIQEGQLQALGPFAKVWDAMEEYLEELYTKEEDGAAGEEILIYEGICDRMQKASLPWNRA